MEWKGLGCAKWRGNEEKKKGAAISRWKNHLGDLMGNLANAYTYMYLYCIYKWKISSESQKELNIHLHHGMSVGNISWILVGTVEIYTVQ